MIARSIFFQNCRTTEIVQPWRIRVSAWKKGTWSSRSRRQFHVSGYHYGKMCAALDAATGYSVTGLVWEPVANGRGMTGVLRGSRANFCVADYSGRLAGESFKLKVHRAKHRQKNTLLSLTPLPLRSYTTFFLRTEGAIAPSPGHTPDENSRPQSHKKP